jgi:hypothetical protein
MRAQHLAVFGLLFGCTRASDQPRPKAVAEHVVDAAVPVAAAPDAGITVKATPSSPFSIVARAPMGQPGRASSSRDIAMAMPLVQRLPDGGLVVASEYARAQATGPGPLAVELLGRGFEHDVAYRYGEIQGAQAIRWVWSDPSLTVVSSEEATMRSGPRVTSYKLGSKGFAWTGGSIGYWSAVARAGSVLALERTAYEIPNSGIYARPTSDDNPNTWGLRPARVAVLAGKGPGPVIPAGVCALAMSAAPDGTVVIAVNQCGADEKVGVLRYAPSSTASKVVWFPARAHPSEEPEDVLVFAASENELYVADGARLQTWDGKAWASTTASSSESIVSLSRGIDGALWAVSKGGRLSKRAAGDTTWTEIALPPAADDALDEHPYAAPALQGQSHFIKDAPTEWEILRAPTGSQLQAQLVDAAGDEILVLAGVEGQAFVLSTKARSPVARLPSVSTQRARIMQTLKPDMVTPKTKYCRATYLMFAEGTTADAIRAKLATAPADAGASAMIGEAIVEGQRRLVVYGEEAEVIAAAKHLATFAPTRACSPAVIEKPL